MSLLCLTRPTSLIGPGLHNGSLSKWLKPTVNVIYAFSETLGGGAGLLFSPTEVIFTSFGVFLIVSIFLDLFVEGFSTAMSVRLPRMSILDKMPWLMSSSTSRVSLGRLEVYTEVPPTAAMTDIIAKIAVEVLNIFAIATKEVKQGRVERFLDKLVWREDMEDALKRLDRLTQEEARMAAVQILRLTQC
ncbi:hypothetical protein EDB86DRAFT_1965827 [Lactarius hatsudake]|nr:hypothetical protein EDB86DRAFT_1965827 [Lactarius hatsudake]